MHYSATRLGPAIVQIVQGLLHVLLCGVLAAQASFSCSCDLSSPRMALRRVSAAQQVCPSARIPRYRATLPCLRDDRTKIAATPLSTRPIRRVRLAMGILQHPIVCCVLAVRLHRRFVARIGLPEAQALFAPANL